MADELQFYGLTTQTGLTVTAQVYDNAGAQVGSDVACAEVGSSSIYIGDMPSASAGSYGVRFFANNEVIGFGGIHWDGSAEITLNVIDTVVDSVLEDTDDLQTTKGERTTADVTGLATSASILALNNLSVADVTGAVPTTSDIAVAVEAAILNEGDGQQVIDAIVQAIGNENVTAATIATTVWQYVVENGETAEEQMRLMRAALSGNIVEDGSGYIIKSADGVTDRITGSADATTRTISAVNGG